jgi:hypothetical protein
MDDVVARGNRLTYWTFVVATAFVLFLWGSGIRIVSLYPDPQWMFGLIGVAAFIAWVMGALIAPIPKHLIERH